MHASKQAMLTSLLKYIKILKINSCNLNLELVHVFYERSPNSSH